MHSPEAVPNIKIDNFYAFMHAKTTSKIVTVVQVQRLASACLPSALCFLESTYTHNASHLHLHILSDLVLYKLDYSIACCTGRTLRGHVAIIMKSSPPFPVSDVELVPGLLPIFHHVCKIKSGGGLWTRLYS